MGDMKEAFELLTRSKKERKIERLINAKPYLTAFKKHTQWHYATILQEEILDYWPTTNKWRWKYKNYYGDIEDLLNFIEKRLP
jgi:hypothetical protein